MYGIDLNKNIDYKYASLRFFNEGEHHIDRICGEDVLLLVFKGVLRFSEDGTEYSVSSGQYHIQKSFSDQRGSRASDSPKYLYVHFNGEWSDGGEVLAKSGEFDFSELKPLMYHLDELAHNRAAKCECSAKFLEILTRLYHFSDKKEPTYANEIAEYIAQNISRRITLGELSAEFNFSRNHIINIFKHEYSVTPFEYINDLRTERAKRLLEVTSKSVEDIAYECGYSTYSNFYNMFLSHEHISPSKWRNLKRLSQTPKA